MKRLNKLCIMSRAVVFAIIINIGLLSGNSGFVSYAKKNSVKYKYDILGKIIEAEYTDGTKQKYIYDNNGNLKSVKVISASTENNTEKDTENKTTEKKTESSTEKKTTEKKIESSTENKTTEKKTEISTEDKTTEKKTENSTENKTTEKKTEESTVNRTTEKKTENSSEITNENKTSDNTIEKTSEHLLSGNTDKELIDDKNLDIEKELASKNIDDKEKQIDNKIETSTDNKSDVNLEKGVNDEKEAATVVETVNVKEDDISLSDELRYYNILKNSRPIITSAKLSKKKGRVYINVVIKQLKKYGIYKEFGYQISYSTNKKFKKSQNVNVIKEKKKQVTKKKFKALKNRIYYIKVRAYVKNHSGKWM